MSDNVNNVNIRTGLSDARPRTYHHGNLRAALVEEGLAAIARDDRANLSLRDVARRIGVSPNAVYRHFADKDALCAAMAAAGFRELAEAAKAAESALPEDDAEGRLEAYGRAYVTRARENPALFRLMFASLTNPRCSDELATAAGLTADHLRHAVARVAGLAPGDRRVEAGALYAWSLVHGLSHLALDGLIAGDADRAIDTVLQLAAQLRQLPDNRS